jgi:hypothetical protein
VAHQNQAHIIYLSKRRPYEKPIAQDRDPVDAMQDTHAAPNNQTGMQRLQMYEGGLCILEHRSFDLFPMHQLGRPIHRAARYNSHKGSVTFEARYTVQEGK